MRTRLRLLLACVTYCQVVLAARMSVARRRTVSRALWSLGAGVFALWTLLILVPAPAFADILGDLESLLSGGGNMTPNAVENEVIQAVDPTTAIQKISGTWFTTAQGYAQDLYGVLIIIEFFMFGLQAILFKDNLGEFLASATFKVFTVGFFIYMISQAQTIFTMIKDSFDQAGQNIAAAGGGDTGAKGVEDFVLTGLGLAAMFFAVGFMGQQIDKSNAEACGMLNVNMMGDVTGVVSGTIQGPLPGDVTGKVSGTVGTPDDVYGTATGNLGCATATPFDHLLYDFTCFGMAMMLAGSVAIVILTLTMITAESYIVMGAGVFFLGFAGSRFTMPFSQGYISYAVNVGVKLFTFWLIVALENAMLKNLVKDAVGAMFFAVTTALLSNYGGGIGTKLAYVTCALALGAGAMSVFQAMIMSALAYSIPQMAGNFISGRSSLSGAQALSGTISTIEGAVGTIANAHKMMEVSADGAQLASRRDALRTSQNGRSTIGQEVSAPMSPSGRAGFLTPNFNNAFPVQEFSQIAPLPLHATSLPAASGAGSGGDGGGGGAQIANAPINNAADNAGGGGATVDGWDTAPMAEAQRRQEFEQNTFASADPASFDPIFGTLTSNAPTPTGNGLQGMRPDQIRELALGRGVPPGMQPAEYFRQLLNSTPTGYLNGRPDLRRAIADTAYNVLAVKDKDGNLSLRRSANFLGITEKDLALRISKLKSDESLEFGAALQWLNKALQGAGKEGMGPAVTVRLGNPDQPGGG